MANRISRRLGEKRDHVKYTLAHMLELPKEILLDLPMVTLVGTLQLQLENHRGIIEFTSERVRINTKAGILEITGKDFFLRTITQHEIIIDGEISGFCYR